MTKFSGKFLNYFPKKNMKESDNAEAEMTSPLRRHQRRSTSSGESSSLMCDSLLNFIPATTETRRAVKYSYRNYLWVKGQNKEWRRFWASLHECQLHLFNSKSSYIIQHVIDLNGSKLETNIKSSAFKFFVKPKGGKGLISFRCSSYHDYLLWVASVERVCRIGVEIVSPTKKSKCSGFEKEKSLFQNYIFYKLGIHRDHQEHGKKEQKIKYHHDDIAELRKQHHQNQSSNSSTGESSDSSETFDPESHLSSSSSEPTCHTFTRNLHTRRTRMVYFHNGKKFHMSQAACRGRTHKTEEEDFLDDDSTSVIFDYFNVPYAMSTPKFHNIAVCNSQMKSRQGFIITV